ncbi:ABC transporter substrate-binding protein [Paenibacillus sp. NPDC056579]|uniref:ABC transporter substrate-binding protein n=1 Tax=Paenibacillus sp. NPDC056579 TaxID=3345871 RepID=UPI0036A083BD
MKKQWLALVSTAALMLTAACNGGVGGGAKEGTGTSPEEAKTKVEDRKAEITFYLTSNNITEDTFNQRYGNKIRERFPNYTIKYIMQTNSQTLPGLITAGSVVDIIITSDAFTPIFITPYNLQYDLTDLIKQNKTDLTQFEPSTIELQRAIANGGIWGLPFGINSASLMYNRDIFDKFGVPYPKAGMTWDQVYELARTMTRSEGGVQYKGLVMSFQHLLYMNQHSAANVDAKTNKVVMTDENFRKAFLNLARFYQIPGNELPDNKYALASQTDAWGKTKTAAMYASLSGAPAEDSGLNWDVVPLPYLTEKPGVGPQATTQYAYLTSLSKDKEAAFKVIEYLAAPEYQKWKLENGMGFSALKDPSLNGSYGKGNPFLESRNTKAFLPEKYAPATIKSKQQSAADKENYAALEAYLTGTDVNTALREAAERLQKIIDTDSK